jgi:hypothetical protein
MSDVSSYEFKALQDRVKRLEDDRLRKVREETERMRRKSDIWFCATMCFWVVVLAIIVTAAITKAIVERG